MKNQSLSPIELLKNEHQLILSAIASLETFVELYAKGDRSGRHEDLAAFVRFIRSYSDAHHHGKEEDILFKQMIEGGFPSEQGPIAVMLSEHDEGRSLVRGLADVSEKAETDVTETDRHLVKENGLAYAELLTQHIQKEDRILYPMALNFLPQEAKEGMEQEFIRFESDLHRKAEVTELINSAKDLAARFPGRERQSEDCSHECFGCGSH